MQSQYPINVPLGGMLEYFHDKAWLLIEFFQIVSCIVIFIYNQERKSDSTNDNECILLHSCPAFSIVKAVLLI